MFIIERLEQRNDMHLSSVAAPVTPPSGLSRRRLARVLGALLTGTAGMPMLAACQRATGPGGERAPAPGRVIELVVHGQGAADPPGGGYDKTVEQFNERFAGKYHATHVVFTGDLYTAQEAAMAAGTIGDLHYAHTSNLKFQEYAVKGAAVALDPFIAKDKEFKLSDWPPRAQDVMKVVDNKVYGLPVRGQVSWLFMYYNKDMLQKAGVPAPSPDWTIDDMIQYARRLQQPDSDFFPIWTPWGGFEATVAHLRRFGAEFFDPPNGPGRRCLLDSPAALEAFRWFHQHYQSGIFAPRSYGWQQFGQGKIAMVFGHLAGQRAQARNAVGNNFAWTFTVVPKGKGGRRGGFLSIDMQQMNSQSKHQDAAWELLKWVTGRQAGINLGLQEAGSLTPGFRKDVYCSQELLNDPRFPRDAMQANCDNIDQPEGYTYPHNFRLVQPGGITEVLNRYVLAFAEQKDEPSPATLKQLTQEIQTILDMPRL